MGGNREVGQIEIQIVQSALELRNTGATEGILLYVVSAIDKPVSRPDCIIFCIFEALATPLQLAFVIVTHLVAFRQVN